MIIQCAWCNRVRIKNRWYDPVYDLLMNVKMCRVTYGICRKCERKVLKDNK